MGLNENKAIAAKALEGVWNARGSVRPEEVYAPGFVSHQTSLTGSGDISGLEAHKSFMAEFLRAFPDFVDTVGRQVAEDDLVVTQFTSAGTHRGDLSASRPRAGVPSGRASISLALQTARSSRAGSAGISTACCNSSVSRINRHK